MSKSYEHSLSGLLMCIFVVILLQGSFTNAESTCTSPQNCTLREWLASLQEEAFSLECTAAKLEISTNSRVNNNYSSIPIKSQIVKIKQALESLQREIAIINATCSTFYGPDCNITAPACNVKCSSCQFPGVCTQCFGNWNGSACSECKTGWTGSDCLTPICSSKCSVCVSPGVCSVCSGNWNGTTCSSCKSGWTGSTCSLSRTFTVKGSADNSYVLFLNGQYLLSGSDWTTVQTTTRILVSGDVLISRGYESKGLGALVVEVYNDSLDYSTGVASWKCINGNLGDFVLASTINSWSSPFPQRYYYFPISRGSTTWIWASESRPNTYATCGFVIP